MDETKQHFAFMLLALEESKKAYPHCLPNPPVGCILVKDGKVISSGYTKEPGHFHAEADAISKTKGLLEGVDVYATLEPCSFHGRTPSCAYALVEKKVRAVYVATLDPHKRNQGEGVNILKRAGIPIIVGVAEAEVLEFINPYLIRN